MKHASRLLSLLVIAAAFVVLTGSICQKSAPERAWDRGAFRPVPENIESYLLPSGVFNPKVINMTAKINAGFHFTSGMGRSS